MSRRNAGMFPSPKVAPNFSPGEEYASHSRNWQGIPSIERADNGRLWMTWYSGGVTEDNDNYALLITSEDDGETWTEPVVVIDPPGATRAWDPCLWRDPAGRMWWTWTQTAPMPGEAWDGRGAIWAMIADNPGDANPNWSEPRWLGHGVALNKPLFTTKGEWLLPRTLWWMFEQFPDLEPIRKPGVLRSTDDGETWEWRGGALIDERVFDEPMVVEKRDGTLWMLMRTRTGIAESFSMDGGVSWSRGRPSAFASPSSRFHFRRVNSGRLMLVNHVGNPERARSHLTVMLSDDDGATWPHRLLLDERATVSYPDVAEGPDGVFHICYDRNRYEDLEVYMAVLTEEDIVAGRPVSKRARLKVLVNKGGASA